jgi:hypothetical protein
MERLCQSVGAAEVVKDSWMRDSDLFGDPLKGEGAESFRDEQVLGSVQDLGASLFGAAASASGHREELLLSFLSV